MNGNDLYETEYHWTSNPDYGWRNYAEQVFFGACSVSYSHDEVSIPIRELCLIAVDKAAIDRLQAEFLNIVCFKLPELEKQLEPLLSEKLSSR